MKRWQIPVAVVSLVVGTLLAAQYKSQADYRKFQVPSRRWQDLVVMLRDSDQAKADLTREVAELRADLKQKAPHALVPMMETTALQGPGVEVTVADSAKPLQRGEDPNIAIVHNDDLLRLVNELRSAGAEAVAINDQRLVASSEIACAGSTILVNKTRLVPPFDVRAIGNPDTMYAALTMRGGIVEYLQFYGIQVKISKESNVLIPMYSGSGLYHYARPVSTEALQ